MRSIALAALVAGAVFGSPAVVAQDWPAKQPLKLISPFPPGSSLDAIGRPVFELVSKALGQSYLIESRPGAGGTIGMAAVAKADPDGYTLLLNSSVHTITPSTYTNQRYDTIKDLAPIAMLAQFPNALVVPMQRHKTIQEMVAAGKAKPGSLTYGSGGVGAATHLNAERLRLSAGFEAVHVPFKGAPEALREIIGNRIDFYFSPLASALPLIEGKEVRALAVSGLKRAPTLPDVPTTLEAGYPNSDYIFWIGMFAPGPTPKPIIERLHREIMKALADPVIKSVFGKLGAEQLLMTPAEFDAFIRAEITSNAALVKAAGIKPN